MIRHIMDELRNNFLECSSKYYTSDSSENPINKHVLYVEVLPPGYTKLSSFQIEPDLEDPLNPLSKKTEIKTINTKNKKRVKEDNNSKTFQKCGDTVDLFQIQNVKKDARKCSKVKKRIKLKSVARKKFKLKLKNGEIQSSLNCIADLNKEFISEDVCKPQFLCRISECTFGTNLIRELNRHKKECHRDFKEFQCHECLYRGATATDLKKHLRQHSNEKPFICQSEGCNFKAKHKNSLVYHTKKYHPTGEPLHCTECDYKTYLPCKLRLHSVVQHGSGKTLCCELCPYKCYVMGDLRKHQRIHTGDSPYKCSKCSYKCKISSNLKKHYRTHTMEQPFQCDQCDFRTNFINSLKVHKRTHTNERPYSCSHCNYRCNHISNLKKHIQRLHPGSILTAAINKSSNNL